jgi:hypothetical protein
MMAVIAMRHWLLMADVNYRCVFIDWSSAMRRRVVAVIEMLDRVAPRIERVGSEDSDQPGDDRPDQRQKDNRLDHRRIPLRMIPGQTKASVRESR